MIRYLYANQLRAFPQLARSMFLDRADQFRTLLGWDVRGDGNGEERDKYDDRKPICVIWENVDGSQGGAMRLLPTVEGCMVNDHFLHLTDGVRIESPLIWECTRFCLARDTDPSAAAALMQKGARSCIASACAIISGVFDTRMVRIYKRIGASPDVLGTQGEGRERISVGLGNSLPELRSASAQASTRRNRVRGSMRPSASLPRPWTRPSRRSRLRPPSPHE